MLPNGRLETFLGGMETYIDPEDWPTETVHLETFLGGMETCKRAGERDTGPNLETFLGGMET